MKKFVQTITFSLAFSLFFATLGFAQFQVTESNGGTANLDGDKLAEWIHWDDGENANSIGVGEAGVWYGFARFETTDIEAYEGMELTTVKVHLNHLADNAAVVIWTGAEGDFTEHAVQEFTPVEEQWVEIVLDNPYVIDSTVELWIGIEIGDPGDGSFPLGCDATTDADGKGNLVTFDGVEFDLLSDFGIAGDWNIQGLIEGEGEFHPITFIVEMTDAVAEGDVAFDPEVHDVYVSGDFMSTWPEPGSDVNYKLEMVTTEKSEVVFYENFNDGVLPDGWLDYDEDGDGNSWFFVDFDPVDGAYSAASASYDNDLGALTPDNWLITPQITGVGENYILNFHRAAVDPAWPAENYDVMISTTGTATGDFTSVYNETLTDGEWEQISIPLADYADEDIYIAFRHHDITDMYVIMIDAIEIIDFVPPTEYFYTVTVNAEEGEREYKYFLVEQGGAPTWDMGEWEGDPNRKITVTGPETFEDVFGVPPVSVPEVISQDGFDVYPNPARDIMNVVSESQINELRVFDLSGKLVFSQSYNAKQAVINVDAFNEGLYIMQIATDNGIENVKFSVLK